ncbi:SpoIIE family protein phosphatase [Marivirga sp. S37H4]|uniref:SpoIIE family protein phosphatase n=1 Tax=Marivirga aurantiaca TaxID=2802615 RepID=A0A934WZT2_9BACT|nr:SpoIIE family protein phosphatase [Marivirga aurantiaca]MBK6266238.1 SpoIIE family protein phosphatase [Marivirga aurantiaca]
MKSVIKYIIFCFVFCPPLVGNGQILETKNFRTTDYLGRTEFFEFTQDDNLILYFGTNAGILSYDGKAFQPLFADNFINNKAVKHLVYFKNSIIFSSEEATYQFHLDTRSLKKLYNKGVVQFQRRKDKLYFVTESLLCEIKLDSDQITTIYENKKNKIKSFLVQENQFTLGTDRGLSIIKNGENIDEFGSFLNAKSILKKNDSTLLILSEDAVFECSNRKILRIRDLGKELAKSFFYSETGDLWIGTTNSKLYQYDGIFLNPINGDNGFKTFEVNYLQKDQESNLWILGKKGLSKIAVNQPFTQLNQNKIQGIFHYENSVLLVKENALVQYKLNLNPSSIDIRINEKITDCSAVYVNEEWIVLINKKYIYRWAKNKIIRQSNPREYHKLHLIDQQKLLSVDEKGQLNLLDENLNPIQSYPDLESAIALLPGDEKSYILQENNDVYQINGKGISNKTSILLSDSINKQALRNSEFGLWNFSTGTTVELLLNEGSVFPLNLDFLTPSPSRIIFNLFEDSNFNLWISFNDQLVKIALEKTGNTIQQGEAKVYNEKDHISSTYFKQSVELENQQIWFVNENKITVYNPLLDNPLFVAPGISIKKAEALVFDEFKNPKDTLNLLSNKTELSTKHLIWIEPHIINHFQPYNSFIEYRNIRQNEKWNKAGIDEKILFNDLPDGQNIIEIQAITEGGLRSSKVEKILINVEPPIWKRKWFYIGSLLSVLLLGFVGYKTFFNYKDSKVKELHEKLDKELDDLERRSHLQILKSERLKQLNELITSQKGELEKKNKQIESQKYELSLTNEQIKKQKDLLEETSSKLKASINYAQRIQNALMSTEVEIKKAIDESFVYFMPRDVVSGDFYWFNKVINDKGEELLILAAVDCTGHGVPGAIVSVVGINLLNNITNLKKIYEPGEILNELNADIIHNLRQNETQVNDGMDMSIVTINKKTREIQFAGAKNPLMYIEDGELIRIRGDKFAIGGQQRGGMRDFQTYRVDCNDDKTRTFYLFSDGYQDQFGGEKGFKFLTSNFKDLLTNIYEKPVLEQKEILYETLVEWKGDYAQTDDILIIGFKF